MLSANGLAFRRSGREVVSDVTLGVSPGEAVGLVGSNGAGKTTIFCMLVGAITPSRGTIGIDAVDVTHRPTFERARLGLGYLPQEPSLFRGLTVEQNLLLTLEAIEANKERRRQIIDELLERFALVHARKMLASRLSGGEQRRCEIARVISTRPRYILLDEPFAKLDPISIGQTSTLIRSFTAEGIGVLISDHNVRAMTGTVDRAYMIDFGRIVRETTSSQPTA